MTDGVVKMDINGILKQLPHRYPFLLVDRVLECHPGETIRALKNVTFNEPFFPGHFPHRPVMPGVMILEAMAQVAGTLVLKEIPDRHEKLVFLSSFEEAKFRRPVRPGVNASGANTAASASPGNGYICSSRTIATSSRCAAARASSSE